MVGEHGAKRAAFIDYTTRLPALASVLNGREGSSDEISQGGEVPLLDTCLNLHVQ